MQEKAPETKRSGIKGKIAFSSYRNGSWQIQVIPSNRELIHTEGEMHYPSWSLDGRKIAYADNEGTIWIIGKDKVPQRIADTPRRCNHPAWSPDGSKIAFVCYYFTNRRENSDIWIADLKQNKAWKLAEQEGIQSYPVWSPDGSKICFTSTRSGKMDIWIMDSNGENPEQLTGISDSNAESKEPDWAN